MSTCEHLKITSKYQTRLSKFILCVVLMIVEELQSKRVKDFRMFHLRAVAALIE
jgi:hypothetical protein